MIAREKHRHACLLVEAHVLVGESDLGWHRGRPREVVCLPSVVDMQLCIIYNIYTYIIYIYIYIYIYVC